MKSLLALAAAFLVGASAQAQNNALAQLGAKGVTTTGGSAAYSGYLVKLDNTGRLGVSMMPSAMDPTFAYSRVVVIDSVNGLDDATKTGGPTAPYATLGYAFQRHGATTDVVYFLLPGTHASATLNPVTYPGLRTATVMGYDSDKTTLTALTVQGTTPPVCTITLAGVKVTTLTQGNNKDINLVLKGAATVTTFACSYTVAAAVTKDPDTTITSVVGPTVTYTYSHPATAISFTYSAKPYTTAAEALDDVIALVDSLTARSNVWNWAASDWSNSVARAISAVDTQRWDWGVSSWSNSVAYLITGDDTNRWNTVTNKADVSYVDNLVFTTLATSNATTRLLDKSAMSTNWVEYDEGVLYYVNVAPGPVTNRVAVTSEILNMIGELNGRTNYWNAAWQNPASATNWLWEVNPDGISITLTNYNFATGGPDVVIPDMLDGLPVTSFSSTIFNSGEPDYIGTAITSLTMGANITAIGDGGLAYCQSLTTLTALNLQTIGLNGLAGCTSLATLTAPNLQTIESDGLASCTSLTTLTVPNLQTIGDYGLYGCTSLTSVYWGQNRPIVEPSGVYTGSPNVTNYVTNPTATGWGATFGGMPVVRLDMYGNVIGNATTATTVTGSQSNLIDTAWQNPASATNWLWSSDGKEITLTNYNFATGGPAVFVPDMLDGLPVVGFGDNTFKVYTSYYEPELEIFVSAWVPVNITSVRGGANIASLPAELFMNCTSLTSVNLPKVTEVGAGAFGSCSSLVSVELPEATVLRVSAFGYCSSLTNLAIARLTVLEDTALLSCVALTNITAPELVHVMFGAFVGCVELRSAYLPKVAHIEYLGFQACRKLISLDLPSVTTIGEQAFDGCVLLNSLTFSKNQPTPASNVFYGITANQVTNYVTNPTATGWGATFGGMPVVRLDMYGNVIGNATTATTVTGSQSNLIDNAVQRTGDTMTGDLTFQKLTPDANISVLDALGNPYSLLMNGQTITTDDKLSGFLTAETDPVWVAVSNTVTAGALAGSTAIQTELDPVWNAVSNTVTANALLGATALQPDATNNLVPYVGATAGLELGTKNFGANDIFASMLYLGGNYISPYTVVSSGTPKLDGTYRWDEGAYARLTVLGTDGPAMIYDDNIGAWLLVNNLNNPTARFINSGDNTTYIPYDGTATGTMTVTSQMGAMLPSIETHEGGPLLLKSYGSGNVLIGTTVDDSYHKLQLQSSNGYTLRLYDSTGVAYINSMDSSENAQPLSINNLGGNVLIGGYIDDETNKLQVNGSIVASNLSGTNTGDQDLSVFVRSPTAPANIVWNGSVDGDLSNPLNYTPNGTPTATDIVLVDETCVNQPSSGSLTCALLRVQNNGTIQGVTIVELGASCSVVGAAEFYGIGLSGTYDYCYTRNYATLETATFNGSSRNDYNGTVTTATFNGSSCNYGTVDTATFNDNSGTLGTVDTATFNGTSYNDGTVTTATFNGSSGTLGTVTTATFYPSSDGLGGWTYPSNYGTIDTATCYWLTGDNTLGGTIANPVKYVGYPDTVDFFNKATFLVSGNVLIGTTIDDGINKLQVSGNVKATSFVGSGSELTGITPLQIGAVSTNQTITINGDTQPLVGNLNFTVAGGSGIDAITATNIAETVLAPYTNSIVNAVQTNETRDVLLNNLTITNSLLVATGSTTNLYVNTNGMFYARYVDPVSEVFNLSNSVINTTCTVTRAMGMSLGIELFTNTTFEVNMEDFPSNSVGRFTICINPGTYTATFSAGMTNANVTLSPSAWTTTYWLKGCFWTKFKGKEEVAP